MAEAATAILSIRRVSHHFGGVSALSDCSWSMPTGSIAALIGPNGAGKSTLVNVVAGAIPLQSGSVSFDGRDVSGWPSHRLASRGLVRTFQIARAFNRLTVLENLLVACREQPGESLWNAVFRPGLGKQAERHHVERALELLTTFELYTMRNSYADQLSGGQRRLLELARSLMNEPRLLILDEPMAAINPVLIRRIAAHLQAIRERGVALLIVEHNLAVVEEICDTVTVMVEGAVLRSGSMADLRADRAVVDAYLGRESREDVAH